MEEKKEKKKKELNMFLRKYRECSSMTQSMLADEIRNNTGGKVRPTVGVINSIERDHAITDSNLYTYLYKQFFFVDPEKNIDIVELAYRIAESCVEMGKELDYVKLLSCITYNDITYYLKSIYNLSNEELKILESISDVVDVNADQAYSNVVVINDTAIFVYNLYFWHFLISNNVDNDNVVKKEIYTSKDFCKLAEIFGFHEFSTTSVKAKGKIARTIIKRLSIMAHYYDFLDKIDYESYFDFDVLKIFFKTLGNDILNDETYLDDANFNRENLSELISAINSSDLEINVESALECFKRIGRITDYLFSAYSLFQGRFPLPSEKYVNMICEKFKTDQIFNINPNLHSIIDSLLSEFDEIMDNYTESLLDKKTFLRAVQIQWGLFDIYKYYYVIKSKISDLENPPFNF